MKRIRIVRPLRVGVALGDNRIVAVRLGRHAMADAMVWSQPLGPPDHSGEWPGLADAFLDLKSAFGRTGRLSLVLLPPLVASRRLLLPKLRPGELRRLLSRDAARYFLDVQGPQLIEAVRIRSGRSRAATFAVAVNAILLQSVHRAASGAGWSVDTVVPAYAVWATARGRVLPALGKRSGHMIIAQGERIEVLQMERGRPVMVRRLPSSFSAAEIRAAIGAPEDDEIITLDASAEVAAQLADRSRVLELVPDEEQKLRKRAGRRQTRNLLLGAAASLALAAGVAFWGTQRELVAIRAQRTAIRQPVAQAMAVRLAMDSLEAQVRTLDDLAKGAPRWSVMIANIAESLPLDAHLAAFRGRPDTLQLEGMATRATGVFEALQHVPGIVGVRADAPIRQEQIDAEQVERFSLTGQLVAEGP